MVVVPAQELFNDLNPSSNPTACGKNEYFEKCTYECPPEKTCETRLIDVYCPDVEMPCIPACVCKASYSRKGPGGECIPEEECVPKQVIYKQTQAQHVNTRRAGNMRRCVVLLTVCYVGLAAELGLHDVSFSLSAHRGCGPNETLNDCVFECPPEKTCDTCKIYLLCLTGDNSCEPKCVCKEGYFRKTEDEEYISDEDCGL
ncbi:hypothetical protein HW555_013583 [Spodoptera exigua]|uniref:TIL domain-containing protein n=1 Tax=Spodoptera exigua TaxID=7107 RepID=A0A835G531_SPOEX|nr:hypothetical protein HW555_013583 [Spodoptera exigua]